MLRRQIPQYSAREKRGKVRSVGFRAGRLVLLHYMGGATGYLEVLTNETNAFSAELGLAQARLNELLALVQLYQALGGGWQQ